jgi:chromosome segregation protein
MTTAIQVISSPTLPALVAAAGEGAGMRLNLVEVLGAIRRTGRQVIVAVEDVALADVLCRRLRSSIGDFGRRFDLRTSKTGTAEIAVARDIHPMPREVLHLARAS